MQLMRPLICCQECKTDWMVPQGLGGVVINDEDENNLDDDDDANVKATYDEVNASLTTKLSTLSPHVVAPMKLNKLFASPTTMVVMQEYVHACQLYSTTPNPGVMATLRLSLPAMRVAGPFHDVDMLALGEIMARHQNAHLSYVARLDFSRASKEGRQFNYYGFRSHGAICLAKLLAHSKHIVEVRVQRHRIGPYGASALFLAASQNPVLRKLSLRRCRIGEKGSLAFAEIVCPSQECGLQDIDLSANRIGFRGCMIIEDALKKRGSTHRAMSVDLEGNLVLQEVMNGVTHGLGVIFAILGFFLLNEGVEGRPWNYSIACNIYSASLLLLYTSSTLYHSFFSMQNTKYIFEALDKCAIYILIAGSYTPFLLIALYDNPLWSRGLLAFIWSCCFGGIYVEAFRPSWQHKKTFSLLMYLGMGWAAVVCLPDMTAALGQSALNLVVMGGVAYTSGVPFFVRNNNLDHSIWHLFVLSGSVFHWLCVYWYVILLNPTRAQFEGY